MKTKTTMVIGAGLLIVAGLIIFVPKAILLRTPLVSAEKIEERIQSENLDEALKFCKRRLLADPNDKAGLYFSGMILLEKRDDRKALKTFKTLIKKNPNNFSFHLGAAKAYQMMLDPSSALAELAECERLLNQEARENAKLALSKMYAMRSLIYMDEQDYRKASQALVKFLELNPQDWDMRYQLGTAYTYAKMTASAYKEFNTIVNECPDKEMVQYAENAIQYIREGRNPRQSRYLVA